MQNENNEIFATFSTRSVAVAKVSRPGGGEEERSFVDRAQVLSLTTHPPTVWIEYTNSQKFVNKNSVKGQTPLTPPAKDSDGRRGLAKQEAGGFGVRMFHGLKCGEPGKFLHHDAAMIWLGECDCWLLLLTALSDLDISSPQPPTSLPLSFCPIVVVVSVAYFYCPLG